MKFHLYLIYDAIEHCATPGQGEKLSQLTLDNLLWSIVNFNRTMLIGKLARPS